MIDMLANELNYFLKSKEEFFSSKPFPHWVIDGMFDDALLSEISSTPHLVKTLMDAKKKGWGVSYFENELEGKFGINNISKENNVYNYLKFLNSEKFIDFLSAMTGIDNLIADNDYVGGGLHMIPRGGKLGVHIDFSKHQNDRTLWRRCNALLYLNQDWNDNWNGHLELWDLPRKKGGKCIKKIKPSFNRLVIFGTLKSSWHGHPTLLDCPDNRMRCSLATYYYSKESGNDQSDHSTIFAENIA